MSWTREQIQDKAARMRANAQYADRYADVKAGVDNANAWEARMLAALDEQEAAGE